MAKKGQAISAIKPIPSFSIHHNLSPSISPITFWHVSHPHHFSSPSHYFRLQQDNYNTLLKQTVLLGQPAVEYPVQVRNCDRTEKGSVCGSHVRRLKLYTLKGNIFYTFGIIILAWLFSPSLIHNPCPNQTGHNKQQRPMRHFMHLGNSPSFHSL